MWQIHFMLWNEVRPDCWYPVIRYRDETGKERSNTFDYGGFRHSWNVGETVEIAWNPGYPGYIYPLGGKWLKQKAVLYGLAGLALRRRRCRGVWSGLVLGRRLPYEVQM